MTKEWQTLAAQIAELQRQLAEVTRERDQFKAACELADALRNQKFKPGRVQVVNARAGVPVVTWIAESPPCAHFAGQQK